MRTVHNGFQRIFITLCSSFSISFCEEPDTYSQWRDYGFEGTGVVLGWSIDSEYPENPLQMWVTYERPKQEAIIDGLIQLHLRHVRAAVVAGNDIAEEISVAGLSLGIFLGIVLHNFKQPKWASENEFRYVYQFFEGYVPDVSIFKTRIAAGVEKRYIEADFSHAELRRVIIGPENDVLATSLRLRRVLDRHGFTETKIFRSKLQSNDANPADHELRL